MLKSIIAGYGQPFIHWMDLKEMCTESTICSPTVDEQLLLWLDYSKKQEAWKTQFPWSLVWHNKAGDSWDSQWDSAASASGSIDAHRQQWLDADQQFTWQKKAVSIMMLKGQTEKHRQRWSHISLRVTYVWQKMKMSSHSPQAFPCRAPQLCPHQSGDQSLPARLHSHAWDSSLDPGCWSGGSNCRGPLRASILACRALKERVARHQPLTLIFPIILCSTVGAGKTAGLWLMWFGVCRVCYI